MRFERVNLFFGLTLLVLFFISGYYMKVYFKPGHFDDFLMRLQIRSNHIYILFVSLLNIFSFKTTIRNEQVFSHAIDLLVRILLIGAGIFSLFAFLFEHNGDISNRILTLITVIMSLTSVGLFLLNELRDFVGKDSSKSTLD